MALSYAGVPLIVPTAEAAAWVESRIPTSDLYPFNEPLLNQSRTPATVPGSALRRPVKLGSLYWPRDASRWATGYFLATTSQLNAIRAQVFTSGYFRANLTLGDGANEVNASMYLLPPRPLDQLPGEEGMWLLPLVDQRYFWWQRPVVNYSPSGFPDAYTALGGSGGFVVHADEISVAYRTPAFPSALTFNEEPVAPLLDAVAANCGQRVVCQPSGLLVEALNPPSSAARIAANLAQPLPVLAGGRLPLATDGPGVLPSGVQVNFPQYRFTTPTGVTVKRLVRFADLALPDLRGFGVNPGTTHVINSPVHALFDFGPPGVWLNQTDCQAVANQLATDFYREQAQADVDMTFAGIAPWTIEGLSDSVEWTYRRESVTTRVCRPPYNPQVPPPPFVIPEPYGLDSAGVWTGSPGLMPVPSHTITGYDWARVAGGVQNFPTLDHPPILTLTGSLLTVAPRGTYLVGGLVFWEGTYTPAVDTFSAELLVGGGYGFGILADTLAARDNVFSGFSPNAMYQPLPSMIMPAVFNTPVTLRLYTTAAAVSAVPMLSFIRLS